jgi:hypothetical protein
MTSLDSYYHTNEHRCSPATLTRSIARSRRWPGSIPAAFASFGPSTESNSDKPVSVSKPRQYSRRARPYRMVKSTPSKSSRNRSSTSCALSNSALAFSTPGLPENRCSKIDVSSSAAFSFFSPMTVNAAGNLSSSDGRGCRPVAISVISGISARNAS